MTDEMMNLRALVEKSSDADLLRDMIGWAMGDIQKMRSLAADLVNSAPDALVAVSIPALAAIQKATHTIPIVFVAVSEPVINGFVPSLAHPGGNATGFSNLEPSIGGKWMEILKGSRHAFRACQ